MTKLLTNKEVSDRLNAMIEASGYARGQTKIGDDALLAAVAAVQGVKEGFLVALLSGADRIPSIICQPAPSRRTRYD